MWRDDVVGSKAHVRGLARVGLLTDAERDSVLPALDQVPAEMESTTFQFVDPLAARKQFREPGSVMPNPAAWPVDEDEDDY